MARRILAILTAILNRRLLAGRGRVGPSRPKPSSAEAARRVPSGLNGPLRTLRRRGYHYYNEHGILAMPGTS
jgi:hypothetical protein